MNYELTLKGHVENWTGQSQGNRSVSVAMTSIQTFYEVRSLDVTWWPNLERPGSESYTTYAENMYLQVFQKRRRYELPFLAIWKTTEGFKQTRKQKQKKNTAT